MRISDWSSDVCSSDLYHLVDERITGSKPKSLSFEEAAALPLTTITAYEALLHRMKLQNPVAGATNAVLIIGGAGGVGSIAIQLVRELTDVTVIATGSRAQTQAWIRELGAHYVIDHSRPMAPQVAALGAGPPASVFCPPQTEPPTAHTPEHN